MIKYIIFGFCIVVLLAIIQFCFELAYKFFKNEEGVEQ